jgi:phosphoribosylformimino-5-aminoimidazole carboxamide ribotide isomerase
MVRGWRKTTRISLDDAISKFLGQGVKIFLITSISKDGTLMGPDYNMLDKATKYFGVNIIAAGGISSLEDLVNLRRIGVWGVVIGKALYEGVLKLREALEIRRER